MQVSVFESLTELRSSHAASLSYGPQPNLFLSLDWYACLHENGLQPGLRPRVYVAEDDGGAALCALYCAHAPGSGRLVSLTNFYTMEYGFAFAPGVKPEAEAALIGAMIGFIAAERPRWHVVDFRLLPEGTAMLDRIEAAFGRNRFRVSRFGQFENWYVPVTGAAFDDYYEARPSRARNTIKRRERKLEREFETRIALSRDFDADVMAGYNAVYDRSWKEGEDYPAFMPAMCRMAAELGALRMGVLYVSDQPAAAQVWLVANRKALIYKLAYDEAFREYSVGSILTREMIRDVLSNDAVDELDYGIGSETYKRDWMTDRRDIVGVECFNMATPKGAALVGRMAAGRMARAVLARMRGASGKGDVRTPA